MAKRRTKFTVSILCANCWTTGDYQFTRGTVLHAKERYAPSEHRHAVPGEREKTIRLNDEWRGKAVECRFCKCDKALSIQKRTEPAADEEKGSIPPFA